VYRQLADAVFPEFSPTALDRMGEEACLAFADGHAADRLRRSSTQRAADPLLAGSRPLPTGSR
jgi:hypothetical protein